MGLNEGEGTETADLIKKLSLISEMMKLMQDNQTEPDRKDDPDTSDFNDERIHNPALAGLKSAIPHLEPRHRKYMEIFVKIIEIQKIMDYYSNANDAILPRGNWRKNLLLAIRPHMEGQMKGNIDLLIKISDMKDMMDTMKNGNGQWL
jgi:hypothetical protein